MVGILGCLCLQYLTSEGEGSHVTPKQPVNGGNYGNECPQPQSCKVC